MAPVVDAPGQIGERGEREVRELLAAAADVDGVEPLGEQPVRALGSAARPGSDEGVVHLVVTGAGEGVGPVDGDGPDDGPVLGYAQLSGTGADATAELAVHPDHRRRGIGRALVSAVWEREPSAAVWAHGELPASAALSAAVGARRDRVLLKMRLAPLGHPADPRPVDGLEFGTLAAAASEGGDRWPGLDARAGLLEVNNAAFDWHPEQGGWTRDQLDGRLGVDWVDPAGVILAVDPGPGTTGADGGTSVARVAGFHWTKVHPDGEGEVYVVGVDPAYQGRRLGGVLTSLGLRHLADRGCASVVLYVEGDNTPALRTYERLGFEVVHRDVTHLST